MAEKQRIEGSCPICGSPCFLSETKSGNEYSFFCKTGKHRGFIAREEDIAKLFQIKELGEATGTEGREMLYSRDRIASSRASEGTSRIRQRIGR